MVGARVVHTRSGAGGYSPSFASRCDLDDRRSVFVKAVSPAQNPESPDMLRSEIDVTQRAPASVPAPRLLHSMDDGDWVVGVFEYVEGRAPRTPWDDAELQRILLAVSELAESELTPALRRLPVVSERMSFTGWRTIRSSPAGPLDDWSRTHLDELVALEAGWADAARGESLVHLDIRSDNIIVEPTGRIVFVDWTQTGIGARWFDVVSMLPSIALEGGGDPEDLLRRFSIPADPEAITAVVAAHAGYFVERGRMPDPPGLPTVRAFQRAQGEVTMRWLRTRLGDPVPQ
jgi:Ser/Thr protein kinase RdoA (MazF antagonist)